jgi:TonB family protein
LKLPETTPPVAIRQVMPQWVPSDAMSRQGLFTGAVRVSISAAGRVEAAAMERSIHPAYDRLLLQSARSWEYQPARRDGVPVPSEQLVQVQLKPRQ